MNTEEDTLLKDKDWTLLPAHGSSMGKKYEHVNFFIVKALKEKPPRLGAILIYKSGDIWVGHRLILKYRKHGCLFLLTKGDGNAHFDSSFQWFPGKIEMVVGVIKGTELIWLENSRFLEFCKAVFYWPYLLYRILLRIKR